LEILYALVLGIVQGLTEFLPISSSGHLVLFQNLFGMNEPELFLDVCLHAGTLVAVCCLFFREIVSMLAAVWKTPCLYRTHGGFRGMFRESPEIRMSVLIVVGSVPTAALGLLFHEMADKIFGSVQIVGFMLLITGTFLWFTRRVSAEGRLLKKMGIPDSLVVGFIQGLAILPGISRSGATISAALFLGIDRDLAGRYSFLLSIPAICGALVLGIESSAMQSSIPPTGILAGAAAAGLTGFFALKALLRLVRTGRIHYFSWYCWSIGSFALLWHFYEKGTWF
jgi:undecaprenyl-diphosphatase